LIPTSATLPASRTASVSGSDFRSGGGAVEAGGVFGFGALEAAGAFGLGAGFGFAVAAADPVARFGARLDAAAFFAAAVARGSENVFGCAG
jgi:hypothetical protein